MTKREVNLNILLQLDNDGKVLQRHAGLKNM